MKTTVLFLLLSIALACGSPVAPERDPDLLLQTDRTSYAVRRSGEFLLADIPYVFTNRTGGPVYLVNCNGHVAPDLERRQGRTWVSGWAAARPDCLSPPVVIEAGAIFVDTVSVLSGLPGSLNHPQFTSEDIEGEYRLIWHSMALSSFDPDGWPFGPELPLEQRVSNSFLLR